MNITEIINTFLSVKKKDQRRAHIRPATESVAVNRVDGPLEHPHDVGNN